MAAATVTKKEKFAEKEFTIQACIWGQYKEVAVSGKVLGESGLGYYTGDKLPTPREAGEGWPTCLFNGQLIGDRPLTVRKCEAMLRDLAGLAFDWVSPPMKTQRMLDMDLKLKLAAIGDKYGTVIVRLYPDYL